MNFTSVFSNFAEQIIEAGYEKKRFSYSKTSF